MATTNFPNGIRGPIHNSAGAQPSAITDLTDNTGGTASDTIANTTGVDVADAGPAQVVLVTEFEAAVASLSAKINELNAALKAAQITAT